MTPWTRWTTTAALASALVLVPAAAHADTAKASARALSVTTSLGVSVGAGGASASSDGTNPDTGGDSGGAPSSQDVVTAGLVVSTVRPRRRDVGRLRRPRRQRRQHPDRR